MHLFVNNAVAIAIEVLQTGADDGAAGRRRLAVKSAGRRRLDVHLSMDKSVLYCLLLLLLRDAVAAALAAAKRWLGRRLASSGLT